MRIGLVRVCYQPLFLLNVYLKKKLTRGRADSTNELMGSVTDANRGKRGAQIKYVQQKNDIGGRPEHPRE